MKKSFLVLSAISIFGLIVGACNAPISGAAGQDPTEPPLTEAPAATEPPTIVPIDLAGPVMAVGSRYTYIDGSILDAVPGGPFPMGYKLFENSLEHTVTLSDYWIYSNEVTNQQFAWCVSTGKCVPPDPKDNPSFENYRFVNFPVIGVNYDQAAAYCGFVHGRLPTEAEWEKAARGPEGNLFPWGNGAPSCDLLNYDFCTGKTLKVLSYPDGVSFYGLSDMSGNVSEWVADWFQLTYDTTDAELVDPKGPLFGEKRSVRSSGFGDGGDSAFSAHRSSLDPQGHRPDLGFRCVVDDPAFFAPYCQGMVLYGADINGAPNVPVVPVADDCIQPSLSVTQDGCAAGTAHLTIDPYPLVGALTITAMAACNGDRPVATCTGHGAATYVPGVCVPAPPPSVDPSCAPGYVSSPDPSDSSKIICTGQGPGVECPDGFTLDPALNCCSADNPGPHQYGFCIAFDNPASADCYNNPGDPILPHPVSVAIDAPAPCGQGPCVDDPATPVDECPGGDDDDNTCTNPPCGPPPGCNPNSPNYPTCLTGG